MQKRDSGLLGDCEIDELQLRRRIPALCMDGDLSRFLESVISMELYLTGWEGLPSTVLPRTLPKEKTP